jgi:plastocyanin
MSKKRCTLVLLMLAALALGSILLAACARPGTPSASVGTGPSSSGSSSSGGGEPTVHMGVSNFVQSSVDVPKGSKLMLIDDGAYVHILSNGSWVNGSPRPAKEPGAPTVNNLQVSGNNVEIGPFATAGTFHIYCSIHPGMNLMIIVK